MGTIVSKPSAGYTSKEISIMMGTNFESACNLCQLAYPLLKASGAGSIVFLSSVAGVVSVIGSSIYGATKGIEFFWEKTKNLHSSFEFCQTQTQTYNIRLNRSKFDVSINKLLKITMPSAQ